MKKQKWMTYEEYDPVLAENYEDIPYIVEEDASIQPAVALQMAVNRYGIGRVLSGYTSDAPADDLPAAEYRPRIEDVADAQREADSMRRRAAELEQEQRESVSEAAPELETTSQGVQKSIQVDPVSVPTAAGNQQA